MSLRLQIVSGLRKLTNRQAAERNNADEVDHYLEEATAEFIAKGLTSEEARRAARLELGAAVAVREQMRGYGWENIVENLVADLHYAVRRLAGSPGFTAVGILTLALGIGASTAIFSIVDAVLLRALPYPNQQTIARVWEKAPDGHRMNLAELNFLDFRSQNSTFEHLAEYADWLTTVSGAGEPARIRIAEVSRGFFETLGTNPAIGRTFIPEEQRLHGSPAAVVSYGYWQKSLGASKELSAFHLRAEGEVFSVVGVMPDGFDFPPGTDLWVPRELFPEDRTRSGHNWRGLGRIRERAGIAQARADLTAIGRRIKQQYGKDADLDGAVVIPLADDLVGNVRMALLTLLGAVGLLLLVACANVAGLLLARTCARRKELAVRAALGAGRGRMAQQFLTESFALSFAGGLLGFLIAAWAVRFLPAVLPANLPRQNGLAINTSVLLFALAAILGVAISLGLFGAWRAVTGDLQTALTAGSRSYTAAGATQRFRGFLVIGEIAMTLVILIGAGLLARSFVRLISTDPGFATHHLITIEFSIDSHQWQAIPDASAAARDVQRVDELLTRLRSIPVVQNAGFVGAMPVAAGDDLADGGFLILNGLKPPSNFEEWGRIAQDRSRTGYALYCLAGEAYFRTMGIPLIRGRLFGAQDEWNSPHVALVSQALARIRWPNRDPIGQVIEFGNMDGNFKPLTIVGIVGDVRAQGLSSPASPIIYVNYRQRGLNANTAPTIVVRSTASAAEVAAAAHGIFHDLAPDFPVKYSTFEQEMGGWLSDRRFLLILVGLFAVAALALAAVGIYGVVAFSVARRTQEIGVRMALGAQRSAVLGLIVGEGARLALAGVVIGIAVSLVVTRVLASLLFGVSATDLLTFSGVATLLFAVALLASYIPAHRAMRLDPTQALRYE